MDPVVSAVLLGFALGLQHATDPDHVVAVATGFYDVAQLRAAGAAHVFEHLADTGAVTSALLAEPD